MTKAQQNKLNSINPILNSFENVAGDLVIDTTYGSKRFMRMFIGVRGGFSSRSIIYKHYDKEMKQPIGKLWEE